ncbi:MAG: cupin domain-containing protein [Synergistaceae bacterium]|nr:cupin domain-containing protein [Synergistaceae bacterium]MBQ9574961.1 cupin domain-containing protein [Synergistaceae bacterium]
MLIDFNSQKEITFQALNNGNGNVHSKMFMNSSGKIIVTRIEPGASIGLHTQNTGNDINFIVSGNGKALCNGNEEILTQGNCHYCPKGSSHSIINTGPDDLVLYTVVQEL